MTGRSLPIDYERGLVEAAVLAALRCRPRDSAFPGGAFWQERERLYEIDDAEAREAAFSGFHGAWFERLTLDEPLRATLDEYPGIGARCGRCVVGRAVAELDEAADLLVAPAAPPTILVRLRPETIADPERLRGLLRHELLHIADMLDPAFGYEPGLPRDEDRPHRARLLADRYRVLWDAFVDGRLTRAGRAQARVRQERLREFTRAFPGLGVWTEAAFERFFGAGHCTHADLVAFAQKIPVDAAPAAAGAKGCARGHTPWVGDA